MSDIVTAISTLNANGFDASMLAVKQAVKADKEIVAMIEKLIDGAATLNSSGRGQVINTYA